ncbi:hypothetical protein [Amycolatopsis sp. cmx-4-61]|uniref:hypothetical protein n=1 Tax=Amycolatopsis sp. cmx-4-61 TaxID=2790937 RepID=UPI00397831E0
MHADGEFELTTVVNTSTGQSSSSDDEVDTPIGLSTVGQQDAAKVLAELIASTEKKPDARKNRKLNELESRQRLALSVPHGASRDPGTEVDPVKVRNLSRVRFEEAVRQEVLVAKMSLNELQLNKYVSEAVDFVREIYGLDDRQAKDVKHYLVLYVVDLSKELRRIRHDVEFNLDKRKDAAPRTLFNDTQWQAGVAAFYLILLMIDSITSAYQKHEASVGLEVKVESTTTMTDGTSAFFAGQKRGMDMGFITDIIKVVGTLIIAIGTFSACWRGTFSAMREKQAAAQRQAGATGTSNHVNTQLSEVSKELRDAKRDLFMLPDEERDKIERLIVLLEGKKAVLEKWANDLQHEVQLIAEREQSTHHFTVDAEGELKKRK